MSNPEKIDTKIDTKVDTKVDTKINGLFSFSNILGFFGAVVGIFFVVSLFNEIVNAFGYKIEDISSNVFVSFGMTISLISCILKYSPTSRWAKFFVFGDFTPFFGCLIFGISYMVHLFDQEDLSDQDLFSQYFKVLTMFFATMSVYHKDKLLGVLTIYSLFSLVVFGMGSFDTSLFLGFETYEPLQRCFTLSLLLVPSFICLKILGFEKLGFVQRFVKYFETGVLFWGTLLSCLSVLIMIHHDNWFENRFLLGPNMLLFGWYSLLLYLGTVFNIQQLTTITGTFGFFWLLDMQSIILGNIDSWYSVYFGIVLLNIYLLREFIKKYPNYFIIGGKS